MNVLALLALAVAVITASLLHISANPKRRFLYAFAYLILTMAPGLNMPWIISVLMDAFSNGILSTLTGLLFLSIYLGLPVFVVGSNLVYLLPFAGLVCWLIAKYKIPEPDPSPFQPQVANDRN